MLKYSFAVLATLFLSQSSLAGQAPFPASAADVPISHHDRVYAAEQFSNTVSVIDPASNIMLGAIRLGDPSPQNLSPLYRGQLLVHGMGFAPDGKTLAVVSIGSNSVAFIDTETNTIKHITYVGRSPHEAFFTPDNKEVWVTIRGEDYVSVLDIRTFEERQRIRVPGGPGMQIFSTDGKYGYVCSSFNPETVVIDTATHAIVGHVSQQSPFCPNIAATPNGKQVWFTLKDTGKVQVFDAKPPFALIKTFDTGPISNHVNFVSKSDGEFAYVTIGGLNEVKVFRTTDFSLVATVAVGALPHGIWPSGDGSRVYVGLENADAVIAIDTSTNKVVATIPAGQAAQALVYVPNAVQGDGKSNLTPLGVSSNATHLMLAAPNSTSTATTIALFDQGLIQVLQAAVTGLEPKQPYTLALSEKSDGEAPLQPLASFTTNPAGAAIVDTLGPIRQVVSAEQAEARRFLVIVAGEKATSGKPIQIQMPLK
jgi:YVTN family beta-propeller protein